MNEIKYIDGGDIRNPVGKQYGFKVICHVVNDIPAMGAGVALALLRKWPAVREKYMEWGLHEDGDEANTSDEFGLGEIQLVKVEEDIFVVNMVAQHGVGLDKDGKPPIRYDALRECFQKVRNSVWYMEDERENARITVHLPYKIGCDLAGGSWDLVKDIIQDELVKHGVDVTVYDFYRQRTKMNIVDVEEIQ